MGRRTDGPAPGRNLYRLLEDADDGQTMVVLEDCRTLDVVLFGVDDVRARMRPVESRALALTPAA